MTEKPDAVTIPWKKAKGEPFSFVSVDKKVFVYNVPWEEFAKTLFNANIEANPRFIREMLDGAVEKFVMGFVFIGERVLAGDPEDADWYARETKVPVAVVPEFDRQLTDAFWGFVDQQQDEKSRFEWSFTRARRAPMENPALHADLSEEVRRRLRAVARDANSDLR